MIKRISKTVLIVFMVIGVAFSVQNFFLKKTGASPMISEPEGLYNPDLDDCVGPPGGCGIGSPDKSHKTPGASMRTKLIKYQLNNQDQINFPYNIIKRKFETIEFLPDTQTPKKVLSFCVTDDELLLIPDYEEGNVKIYEKKGNFLKLVQTIGRKGFGKTEFTKPIYCYYNKMENRLGVMDFGKRKISIYDRIGRVEFEHVLEVPCVRGGSDFRLVGDRLLISGFILSDKNEPYDLYYVDLKKDNRILLLPSHEKYGVAYDEYALINNRTLAAIGMNGWFDVLGNDIFYVWEGNLRIIKLNIETGKVTSFGKEDYDNKEESVSHNYLLEDHDKKESKQVAKKWAGMMSYVRDIFVNSDYVFLIYEKPAGRDNESRFRMQLYTTNGVFLKDFQIPGNPGSKWWFDKEKSVLYSLAGKPGESQGYHILKYELDLPKLPKKSD